jgi:hypothetical protein
MREGSSQSIVPLAVTFYYVVVVEQTVDQWCNAELQNTDTVQDLKEMF